MTAEARCVHGMLRGQCATCRAAKQAGRARSRVARSAKKRIPGKVAARSLPRRTKATGGTHGAKRAKKPTSIDAVPDYDSGIRLSEDPDAATKRVWVFKTGQSYHRRDCHIIESRDGAAMIPIAAARRRGLERCMHCVPTVR